MRSCEWVRSQLKAYLDGECRGSAVVRIKQHLSGCEACRAEADALARIASTLRSVPGAEPSPVLRGRILDALPERQPSRPAAPARRWRWVPAATLAGTLAAVGLAVGFFWTDVQRSAMVAENQDFKPSQEMIDAFNRALPKEYTPYGQPPKPGENRPPWGTYVPNEFIGPRESRRAAPPPVLGGTGSAAPMRSSVKGAAPMPPGALALRPLPVPGAASPSTAGVEEAAGRAAPPVAGGAPAANAADSAREADRTVPAAAPPAAKSPVATAPPVAPAAPAGGSGPAGPRPSQAGGLGGGRVQVDALAYDRAARPAAQSGARGKTDKPEAERRELLNGAASNAGDQRVEVPVGKLDTSVARVRARVRQEGGSVLRRRRTWDANGDRVITLTLRVPGGRVAQLQALVDELAISPSARSEADNRARDKDGARGGNSTQVTARDRYQAGADNTAVVRARNNLNTGAATQQTPVQSRAPNAALRLQNQATNMAEQGRSQQPVANAQAPDRANHAAGAFVTLTIVLREAR